MQPSIFKGRGGFLKQSPAGKDFVVFYLVFFILNEKCNPWTNTIRVFHRPRLIFGLPLVVHLLFYLNTQCCNSCKISTEKGIQKNKENSVGYFFETNSENWTDNIGMISGYSGLPSIYHDYEFKARLLIVREIWPCFIKIVGLDMRSKIVPQKGLCRCAPVSGCLWLPKNNIPYLVSFIHWQESSENYR